MDHNELAMDHNEFGQPIGALVPGWTPCPMPTAVRLLGDGVQVVELTDEHLPGLLSAIGEPGPLWTYLPSDPPTTLAEFGSYVESLRAQLHPVAITGTDGAVRGMASYLNINQDAGSIEVGHIAFGPQLARTRAATEAMYLMARHALDDLGYRRYEWKCNALNAPSRSAARRLGFAYEGTFANAAIVKGRNRDTSWFSITDREWPPIRAELERWLAAANFDDGGRQLSRLRAECGHRG